jgi:hypothetical protein
LPSRQKITVKGDKKPLADEVELSSVLGANLHDGELQVKDLGAQISWRTVFIVEYVRLRTSYPVSSKILRLDWSFDYPPAGLLFPSILVWPRCGI